MNTVIKKYGAGIFGLLIIVLTAVAGVKDFNLVTILQLVALFVSSVVSVGIVGVLPGKWPGALKTIAELVGTAIALVLPFALAGAITWNEILLVVIGVIKAAATEFGVAIRTDGVIDATGSSATVADPAVVTTLPAQGSPMTPSTLTTGQSS